LYGWLGVSDADMACLGQVKHHFHPSVTAFANGLMKDQVIAYKGDPLQDLTLMK
jgi:hypothetical protein